MATRITTLTIALLLFSVCSITAQVTVQTARIIRALEQFRMGTDTSLYFTSTTDTITPASTHRQLPTALSVYEYGQTLLTPPPAASNYDTLRENNVTVTPRRVINFYDSDRISVNLVDDGANNETEVQMDLRQQGATSGQVLKWNGSTWSPANDISQASGETNVAVNLGNGAQVYASKVDTTLRFRSIVDLYGIDYVQTDTTIRISADTSQLATINDINVVQADINAHESSDSDLSATNEIQSLTIDSTTVGSLERFSVSISSGNTVRFDVPQGTFLTDGDKGDVDVTSTGATWTVDTSAITGVKIAANAVDSTKVGTGALSVTDIGQHGASSGQVLKWNGTQWASAADNNSGGTVTAVGLLQPAAGITVSGSPISTSGNMTLALANDLAALESVSTTGIAVRSGIDTWVTRTITAGTGISVTNGDGVSAGNIVIASTQVGLTDGDKGDIDVTASGATWTVDTSAITTIKIAANAVDSTKIATGGVSVTDIGQHGASSGQVLKWNGTQWAAAADATGSAGGGEINVGANLGAGTGVYEGKVDTTLRFKSITEGYGLDLTASATEIDIKADTSQLATVNDINIVHADIDAHELADADLSATNEIQTIDTFDISGNTIRASLSGDNQPFKSVNLAPYLDNTDTSGYNLSFTRSNDTLRITDGSSTLFAVLPADQVGLDTSGYNISATVSSDSLYITDGDGTINAKFSGWDTDVSDDLDRVNNITDTFSTSQGWMDFSGTISTDGNITASVWDIEAAVKRLSGTTTDFYGQNIVVSVNAVDSMSRYDELFGVRSRVNSYSDSIGQLIGGYYEVNEYSDINQSNRSALKAVMTDWSGTTDTKNIEGLAVTAQMQTGRANTGYAINSRLNQAKTGQGITSVMFNSNGTGNAQYAFFGTNWISGSGVTGSGYGLYLNSLQQSSGVFQNYYGVFIADPAATTARSIYSPGASARMEHAGSAIFGATGAPVRTLHVTGEARITDLQTDNPTRLVGADADGDLNRVILGSNLTLSNDTLNAAGGSGSTDLSFSGASSPVTLASSSGTDVRFVAGSNVTLASAGDSIVIAAAGGGTMTAGNGIEIVGDSINLNGTITEDVYLSGNKYIWLESTDGIDGKSVYIDKDYLQFTDAATGNNAFFMSTPDSEAGIQGLILPDGAGNPPGLYIKDTIIYAGIGIGDNTSTIRLSPRTDNDSSTFKVFNKYFLPNATPSTTLNDTTIMAWSGDGATASPIGFIPLPSYSAPSPTVITPSTITSDQDNYSPTDWATATIVRISGDSMIRAITGFASAGIADGHEKKLVNVGAFPVYIPGQHPDSQDSNRVNVGYDYMIYPKATCVLVYDNTANRWIVANESYEYGKNVNYYWTPGSATAGDNPYILLSAINSGTTANVDAVNGVYPRAFRGSTSATASSGYIIGLAKGTGDIATYGDCHIVAEGYISLSGLSVTADTFYAGIQIGSITSTSFENLASSVNIIYSHIINGGNWSLEARDGANASSGHVDLGVAAAIDVPVLLRLELDKSLSEARAYINGAYAGRVTTNFPATTTLTASRAVIKKAATGAGGDAIRVHSLKSNYIYD